MRRCAALAIPRDRIVDPEGKRIACYRGDGGAYRHARAGEGDTQLVQPGWPALADLWR